MGKLFVNEDIHRNRCRCARFGIWCWAWLKRCTKRTVDGRGCHDIPVADQDRCGAFSGDFDDAIRAHACNCCIGAADKRLGGDIACRGIRERGDDPDGLCVTNGKRAHFRVDIQLGNCWVILFWARHPESNPLTEEAVVLRSLCQRRTAFVGNGHRGLSQQKGVHRLRGRNTAAGAAFCDASEVEVGVKCLET